MSKITYVCNMKYCIPLLFLALVGCKQDANVDFKWNFKTEEPYNYKFIQSTKNEITGPNAQTESADLSVDMTIEPQTDSTAMLTMKNGSITSSNGDTQQFPDAPGMILSDHGTFDNENNNALFSIFLVLPRQDLKIGETDTVNFTIPYYYQGQNIYSEGTNVITFKEIVDFEGNKCAVLKGVINYTNPTEILNNEDAASTGKGEATYYFNIEKGIFEKNMIVMDLYSKFDSQTELTQHTEIELLYKGY